MFLSFFSSLFFYGSVFLLATYYICCFIFEEKFASRRFEFCFGPRIKFDTDYYQIFNFLISILTIMSFFGLILCFGMHDFNLYIVYANSQTKQNYIYSIGACWGSYEGSMLLWLVLMSITGFFNSIFKGPVNLINKKTNHLIQHFSSGFQLFFYMHVLLNANPFKFMKFNQSEGLGFNPLLQDYALLTHPPILFFGYATSFAIFSKILGFYFTKTTYDSNSFPETEKRFYRSLKNFILTPLCFLTIGIFLGGHWSYRELGWGGFWAWDPVENVSLLPWLSGIAALHLIFEKDFFSRKKAFFLALNSSMMFILSIFATFVVRSGFVSSIHSFAQNSGKSFLLLVLILISILIFLISCFVFFKKDNNLKLISQKFSRKYFFLFTGSNLILILCAIIIFSILVPIFYFSFSGQTINFGEDFFEKTFGIVLIPILLTLNISYFFGDKYKKYFWFIFIFQGFFPVICALFFHIFLNKNQISLLALINIFSAAMSFINTGISLFQRKFSLNSRLVGHFAFSLLIFSSILSISTEKKEELYLTKEKNQISILEYRAELTNLTNNEDENIVSIVSKFEIFEKNQMIGIVLPKLKFYKFEKMQIPDSDSIFTGFFSQIYIVTPRLDYEKKSLLVQIYYKPFIGLVWLSGLLMTISLSFNIFKFIFRKIKNS